MIYDYNPPEFVDQPQAGLYDKVKNFFAYWERYFTYEKKWTAESQQQDDISPFTTIAAGSILAPTRKVQAVSGSTTVQTISAQPNFSPFTIMAIDGFSTGTSGNIAASVSLAAGTTKRFYYNPVLTKWFPSA